MRRLAVAAVIFVCAFCAGAAGAHRFAGMTGHEAAVSTRAVARTFAPSLLSYEDPQTFERAALLDVSRSTDSTGREAWLALFRYPGGADAACIWVRRAAAGPWSYVYEETQSVANGHAPERVHDRCARIALRRHLLGSDPTVGSEIPTPVHAYPVPVSPFGVIPHGSYLADLEETDAVSLSGVPAKFPQTTPPGTSGLVGFVLDGRFRVVAGATIAVRPSSELSGFFRIPPGRPYGVAVTATTDRHGAFAILGLPSRQLGYDYLVTAAGYAPAYEVHVHSLPGLYSGDVYIGRTPRFKDETPGPPPCGTDC